MYPLDQHQAQVAGLLAYPCSDRVGGDPGHVHPSGVELDEEQHVETAKQHRVDDQGADSAQRPPLGRLTAGPVGPPGDGARQSRGGA